MNSLRIVLVSPLAPPVSGIGRWTEVVLQALARDPSVEVALVDTAVRWRGVHQLEWWRRVLGGGLQSARDTWRTWRALRRTRAHVLHVCTSAQVSLFRDLAMLGLARLKGVRSCYHLHFGRVPDIARRRTIEWWLLRLAGQLATVTIAIDSDTETTLRRSFAPGRVVYLPNCLCGSALAAERDAAWCDDRQVGISRATFIGHVKEPKGALDFARSMVRLAQTAPLEAEFVGPVDEDCRARISAVVADSPLRVLFRESRSHGWAMEALRHTDVLALPSHTEGFPNVVLEAMALGVPVVASRVGAIAEMLEAGGDSPCGLLVEPKDIDSLAIALQRVLSDPALWRRLGESGRGRFATCYDSAIVVAQLVSVWRGGR